MGLMFKGQQPAANPVDPPPSSEHDTGPAASEHWRSKGYRRKHASSKKNFVLWCATNLAQPKPDHKPKCDAKVLVRYVAQADGEQRGVWQLEVLESHSLTCCYHGWEGKLAPQGDWLAGGVREKVEEAYFESKHKPSRIARDLLDTGNCRQFTRRRLRRLVSAHITNVKRKCFGAGSHMTRAQLHELVQNTPEHATKDTTDTQYPTTTRIHDEDSGPIMHCV